MAELKATVCLQGKDIEVISSHIEFNRKTDNKGRPVTNVIGGRITITVESFLKIFLGHLLQCMQSIIIERTKR